MSPEVTELDPAAGPGDANPNNEFVVDGLLRVNDYIYLTTPMPNVGETYTSITGILDYRNGNSKLEPRRAADLASGPPVLRTFGSGTSFLRTAADCAGVRRASSADDSCC